jgi:hypothetical protein
MLFGVLHYSVVRSAYHFCHTIPMGSGLQPSAVGPLSVRTMNYPTSLHIGASAVHNIAPHDQSFHSSCSLSPSVHALSSHPSLSLSGKSFVVGCQGASLGRKPTNDIVLSLSIPVSPLALALALALVVITASQSASTCSLWAFCMVYQSVSFVASLSRISSLGSACSPCMFYLYRFLSVAAFLDITLLPSLTLSFRSSSFPSSNASE